MYYEIWILFIILNIAHIYMVDKFDYQSKKIIYCFLIFFESFLLAVRPMDLPDVTAYKDIFEYVVSGKNYGLNLLTRNYATGVEYGFIYFIFIFKFLVGNRFRLFLFVISFVTTILMVEISLRIVELSNGHGLDKKDKYELRTIIVSNIFCYFSLNYQGIAIRQAMSLALCLCFFYYWINHKYIRSIAFFILAFSIHRMSVIFLAVLLIYILFPVIKSKKMYGHILGMSILGYIVISNTGIVSYVMNKFSIMYSFIFRYIDYSSYLLDNKMIFVLDKKRVLVILLFFLIVYYMNNENVIIGKLYNIYLCGIAVLILTLNIEGSARIYDYLTIFHIPLLALCWLDNKRNFNYKNILVIFLVLEYIVSFRIWGII